MDFIQILLLALVQGVTEYLPVSSSAHLVLAPRVLGYSDQGLAFDVAVHVGSLLAVCWYFRGELVRMARSGLSSVRSGNWSDPDARLLSLIVLATLPIVLAGMLFESLVANELRSPLVIAVTTIGFGVLLYWADVRGKRNLDENRISIKQALWIGIAQVLALIPGTSRSGITMTAGLLLGLTREATARFSFLLAIPTIAMSGTLVTWELIQQQQTVDWSALTLGVLLSFIAALSCIHVFLQLVERIGMLPFMLYRLLLGTLILIFLV